MAFPTCSPPTTGAGAGRSTGVGGLPTGRVDPRLDAIAGYERMFDLPPLDIDDVLLHEIGADDGRCRR
jgi:hypothetical protein